MYTADLLLERQVHSLYLGDKYLFVGLHSERSEKRVVLLFITVVRIEDIRCALSDYAQLKFNGK